MTTTIKKKLSRLRYIIASAIFVLLIFASLVFILFTQQQKPDPASEQVLRQAAASQLKDQTNIEKDPNELTDEDFSLITRFSFVEIEYNHSRRIVLKTSKEISDIKLLNKFTNLKSLSFQYVSYPEDKIPKWMKFLARIGIIDLNKRCTIDLSPIKKLTSLENLEINDLLFKNFKPLSNLVNLKVLMFQKSRIRNLEPIKGLTKLEKLYIYDCKVTDIGPIKNLTNLKGLYIHCKEISDIGPIRQLTNLRKLELINTQIYDFEPLKQLKNIEELYIINCPANNIETLKELTNLNRLLLDNISISDIEPLKNLTNLRNLSILRCDNITDKQVEELQKALPNLKIER